MFDYLEKIDHGIVLSVNGCYTPFLGQCMWFISGKLTWIPLYLIILFLAYKKFNKVDIRLFYVFIISVFISVGLSDLMCTYLFKKVFLRYRPSHNLILAKQLHLYYESSKQEYYKGGMYGFISSHAANFFAIATFVGLALKPYYKKLIYILLFIASLVAFSRLFLGVHYLSDLIGGAILGSTVAYFCYRFIFLKYKNQL